MADESSQILFFDTQSGEDCVLSACDASLTADDSWQQNVMEQ